MAGNQLRPFNSNFGDWFILHQLYKNMERNNYVHLVSGLCGIKTIVRRNETFVRLEDDDVNDEVDGTEVRVSKDDADALVTFQAQGEKKSGVEGEDGAEGKKLPA